ncbi:transposase [Specibacter cremeus]|uniref:transposase n=1 Tax=Specibacter cremeus TaxID=1629051 RepID=UPI000F79E973|nr:transposase [Specibacter cremeus]
MGSTRRSFTDEYKRDAVALITDGGYTVAAVAKKLEISETTMRKWMKKVQPDPAKTLEKPLTESERTELQRLRQENAKLAMQLDFAKKVSTWFAKGQQ